MPRLLAGADVGACARLAVAGSRGVTCLRHRERRLEAPEVWLTTTTGHTVLRFTSGRSAGTFPPPPRPRPVSLGDLGVAQFIFSAADYQAVADKACPSSTRLHLVLPDGSEMVQPQSFSLCGRGGIGPFTEPGILTQPYFSNGTWQRGAGAG